MGANANATCRLNHVSACHIAAMHDNEALELLLKSGADRSRSDKHGRTPLHLAAWAGNVKQIALLLNFPEGTLIVGKESVPFNRLKKISIPYFLYVCYCISPVSDYLVDRFEQIFLH